jgi:hypothetical protein
MTTKELVENFRFKVKTTRRDLCGSGVPNGIAARDKIDNYKILEVFLLSNIIFILTLNHLIH